MDPSISTLTVYEQSQISDMATQLHYQLFPDDAVLDVIKGTLTHTTGLLGNPEQNTKDVIAHLLTAPTMNLEDCNRLFADPAFTYIVKIRLRSAESNILLFAQECLNRAEADQERWKNYPIESKKPYNPEELISLLNRINNRVHYFLNNRILSPENIPGLTLVQTEI